MIFVGPSVVVLEETVRFPLMTVPAAASFFQPVIVLSATGNGSVF